MKKITLIITLFVVSISYAQTTFEIIWEQGVNGAAASRTIEPGDTVRWVWGNTAPHDVESTDPDAPGDFSSGIQTGQGFVYEYTFTTESEIDYLCTIHPGTMFGTITIEEQLSVEDKFASNVKYFPNPVKDVLVITSQFELDSYVIRDVLGKMVGQQNVSGTRIEVGMSNLAAGMYLVTATSGSLKTTFQVNRQ
ncbi:MAG: hypothetical protein ACI86C_001466 [Candidatus Latescibacterota bacterium]|jgi:hypothetical protein